MERKLGLYTKFVNNENGEVTVGNSLAGEM